MHFFSPPDSILGTRYKTVLFRKLADAFLMIYEILHPIFDALEDEFGFHDLDCDENHGSVRRVRMQMGNAQNLRRNNQRKENSH